MTLPLPIILFVFAATMHVVSRLFFPFPRRRLASHETDTHLKILLRVPSRVDWNNILWQYMKAAGNVRQLRFAVLVECLSLSDTETCVDPLLQSICSVEYVLQIRDLGVDRTVRRLTKRFVVGDETVVVMVDHHIRPRPSYDVGIVALCQKLGTEETVVSVPSRCTGGRGHFPCLGDDGRRSGSLPYRTDSPCLVPCVCLCSEFIFGRPSIFKNWRDCSAFTNVGTPFPLVHDDPQTESHHRDVCEMRATSAERCTRVGIVDRNDETERTLKFGSARAGKLAIRLGYDFCRTDAAPQ